GISEEAALEAFRDPVWRLNSLYSIRTRDGSIIPFRPRQQQQQIIDLIYRQDCRRIIILKARQLGFSTLLGVVCADRLCFGMGQQISLVDQTLEDARQKLRDITLVAYESLDPALKNELPITRSNTGELAVKFVRHEEAKSNTMFAGTHARGGANSFLWVSEWGVIQATDLARSEEILTGALPSVGDGVCVVETTWKGGRNGHLWSLVKSALETPEDQKGPLDWRVVFFPWQNEPFYCDAIPRPLSEETQRYFADKPDITPGQQSWYQRKRAELGMFIKREYPTMLEECFQAPVEGAIYAEQIDKLRAEGAIRPWIVDNSLLTHTCWDLGSPINTVVWYFQLAGADEIRVVDCDMDLDLTPVERVARMLAKGYLYGSHFLPHDALATQKSGRTFLSELKEAGLTNLKAVPRTDDVWVGVNRLRQMLPRFSFRVPQCERGLEALCNYRTMRETSTGLARDEPVHDFSSHACDALRVVAEADMAHMLSSAGSTSTSVRRQPVKVIFGFRGHAPDPEPDILDRFFGGPPRVRVIR
ncbi:MAG TPA: hypothetical protein VGD41_18080, partial [Pyrinomonadaceae bacterium]